MFIHVCLVPERSAACLDASCASFSSWSWSEFLKVGRLLFLCFVFCSLKGKKSVFRVPAFIARRGSSTKSSRLNMETFLSSSHTAFVSPLVPPQNRLSGYSVSGNARLQHVAQMDALRSRSSWRQLLWRPSPWGLLFFSWVAVGSQRQGNCMNSEKGEVNTSFPWLRKMKKKKEVTAALDSSF